LLEAEFTDRRFERPVENVSFDEIWGLEQRVALARFFREILIEVAEPARTPFGVGKVVVERTGLGHSLAKEID